MINSKVVDSKNGFSINEVTKTDENGKVISINFEVCDSDGNVLGSFDDIGKAKEFIESKINPASDMGM